MKLVIDIDENDYYDTKNGILLCISGEELARRITQAFQNCTIIDDSTEKVGEWKLVYRDCGIEYYLCSKCHEGKVAIDGDYYKNITEFIYCPNCGSRMMEVEE